MTQRNFHITKKGAAAECKAKKTCPLGGTHYNSMPEAMSASNASMASSSAPSLVEHPRATAENYSDDELRDRLDAARIVGADSDAEVLTEVLAERNSITRVNEWANQAVQKGFFDSMDADQLRAYIDNGPEVNTTEGIKKHMAAIGEAERRDDEAKDATEEDAELKELQNNAIRSATLYSEVHRSKVATILAPAKISDNAQRIYEYLTENGLDDDSAVREAAFEYAAEATGRDYGDYYDSWISEHPIDSHERLVYSKKQPMLTGWMNEYRLENGELQKHEDGDGWSFGNGGNLDITNPAHPKNYGAPTPSLTREWSNRLVGRPESEARISIEAHREAVIEFLEWESGQS